MKGWPKESVEQWLEGEDKPATPTDRVREAREILDRHINELCSVFTLDALTEMFNEYATRRDALIAAVSDQTRAECADRVRSDAMVAVLCMADELTPRLCCEMIAECIAPEAP